MALILSDRVQETTTTAGTGTITLAGAVTGYQSFAVIGNGNTTYYCIAGLGTNEWEVGIGTYSSAGTTLARTTILASSSGGSVVTFSAGSKSVFVTYPAEKSVNLDASDNASALGTPVSFVGTNITGTAAGLTAGAATALATARTIAGVSFDGTADIAIPLGNLSTVTLSTPVVNQLLGYNGTYWTNTNATSSSAGTGVVFYNATPSISPVSADNDLPILTLPVIPVTTAEQTISGTAAVITSGVFVTTAFSAFTSGPLNRTVIDAGVWDFTTWINVSSNANSSFTTLTRQVYSTVPFVVGTVTITGTGTSRTATASSGTPFATSAIDASAVNTDASYLQTPDGVYQITARTSDTVVTITTPTGYTNESAVAGTVWKKLFGVTTPEITTTPPNYIQLNTVITQPDFPITLATGIAIVGFVTSDRIRTITITYNGTSRNTHVNSPLANLHNELAGLNGGTVDEYYHSTLAEYTGTGTGVFVRDTNPILVTPALGTPTALVGTNITGTATAFTSSNVTTNANLTGEVTSVGNAATVSNAAVIAKVLTGYTSGAGTVSATDSILTAIQKLNGNAASSVSSISFASTGLTPATPTTGAVVVAGTLGTGYGGTNIISYTTGDILYASATNVLSRLASTTSGYVLTAGGVGVAPAWADLTTEPAYFLATMMG